jgi:hypothetical protein
MISMWVYHLAQVSLVEARSGLKSWMACVLRSKVKLGYDPLLLSALPPSQSGVMRDAASSSDGSGAVSRAGVDAAAPPPRRQRRVVCGDAPAPAPAAEAAVAGNTGRRRSGSVVGNCGDAAPAAPAAEAAGGGAGRR